MRERTHHDIPMLQCASLTRALAALALAALAAGCAPEAWQNNNATGFNGYLNQIGKVCQPLLIGNTELSQMIQYNATNENYNYFVDVTSRLYYNQMSPDLYRQDVVGFFGPGSSNEKSFQCIFANLPAVREPAPAKKVIMY